MAPIAKENDAAILSPSPAGNAADPARTQPVALEIPVTVNGARTMEGSDKREPFSETTQTVLVFTNGAVIRLASTLASGQLVFLTNEKSKKEVVCQVVKSKNYRTVTGYVELEFTEPAPGFWGMRFPSAPAVPPPTQQSAPRPAVPAPSAAAPSIQPPPAPVKPIAPSVTPVAAKPAAPALVAPKPVIMPVIPVAPLPPAAIASPGAPKAPAPPSISAPVANVSVAPPVTAPSEAEAAHTLPSTLPQTTSPSDLWDSDSEQAKRQLHAIPVHDFAKQIDAIFSVPQAPAAPPAQPAPPSSAISASPAASKSASTSTGDLKQQAARLQEELSAMLFTDAAKPAQPQVVAPVNVPDPKFVTTNLDSVVRELTQEHLTTTPTPAPPKPVTPLLKVVPPVVKPIATSLDAEEVQIPAWLAPLTRNAESESAHSDTSAAVAESSSTAQHSSSASGESSATTEYTSSSQSEIFGGGILSDALDSPGAGQSGSKTGLFLGLAAAAALLIGGGYWYSRQPGNLLTSASSSSKPVVTSSLAAQPSPSALSPATESVAPASSATVKSLAPAPMLPSATSSSSNSDRGRDHLESSPIATAKNANSSSRVSQPVEQPQPKKPTLGDVRLSSPVVNRSGSTQEMSASDPGVDAAPAATASDPLASLGGHDRGPSAPLPIGGDVKPATLLKSVPPLYPQLARSQHVSGNVQIDALIDKDGNVSSAKVISGPPLLHQAAVEAVKQWKYAPAKLDGNPTSMHLTITVQFRTQ
jgi:TonB family protein